MKENKLEVRYIPVDQLKPYKNNARKHTEKDVQSIVESIKAFGFNDPIAIWGDENLIVEGHGRVLAAKKLGIKEVPYVRLDHLTEEERRAYAIAHNKTGDNSTWDFDFLGEELKGICDFDMTDFGFGENEIIEFTIGDYPEEPEGEAEPVPAQPDRPAANPDSAPAVPVGDYGTPEVSKEELAAYRESASRLLATRRVIIVFREQEEPFVKGLLGLKDSEIPVVIQAEAIQRNLMAASREEAGGE